MKQNHNTIQYVEPTPILQNTAYKMIVNNVNEWYKVMNIRYYEHLALFGVTPQIKKKKLD